MRAVTTPIGDEGRRRPRHPRIAVALAALSVVLILAPIVVGFLVPWNGINCWTDSIDIRSGRYRYERYVWYVKISERIEETGVSDAYRSLVGEPGPPDWRRVNIFSPGVRNSPHYLFHGALHACREIERAFGTAAFSDPAKRKAVLAWLSLLQEDGSDFRARDYSRSVFGKALDALEAGRKDPIGPDELPAVPAKEGRPASPRQ